MRYENPLYLAEEAAALDLIADGRGRPLDAHQAAEPGPRPRGGRHPPPDDPNQLGFEENWSIIRNFAEYVAPALGWEPARPGVLPTGYDIDEAVAE